jgi:hypothetical protein
MENIDLIFLFVIAAFVGYYMCKSEKFTSVDTVEGFSSINDARQAVREVYNADIDAIRNLSTVATRLQAGGLTIPGTLKVTAGQTIEGLGRLHMNGPELLYILNKNGMVIGKEWGGNGNLQVQGNLQVNENINGPSISTNNPTWNGWISGNFGSGTKDRVVIGNHLEQATVGAHSNDLKLWRPLRLQGDSINMIANNGNINASGNINVTGSLTAQGMNIVNEINALKNEVHVLKTNAVMKDKPSRILTHMRWGNQGWMDMMISDGHHIKGNRGGGHNYGQNFRILQ